MFFWNSYREILLKDCLILPSLVITKISSKRYEGFLKDT